MLSFNRLPKNKKFNYKPRYYDPEAEEKSARRNPKLEKGSFTRHRPNILLDEGRRSSRVGQNVRIFFIILLLGVGVLYILGVLPALVALGIALLLLFGFSINLRKSAGK